jgi:hypothetical protein
MSRGPLNLFQRNPTGHANGNGSSNGFPGTIKYWEQRYRENGTSGLGSWGIFARFKARFVNGYIRENNIRSVIDFGAGDGNQLRFFRVPSYIGLDTSDTAISRLRRQFADDDSKQFVLHDGEALKGNGKLRGELGLSLDVIYHLVEDSVFERYMHDLFHCAQTHVIIYSSNNEPRWRISRHVRDRKFSTFVDEKFPTWRLERTLKNPLGPLSRSDFYVYRRRE